MSKRNIILTIIGATIAFAYLFYVYFIFDGNKQEGVCEELRIEISDLTKRHFTSNQQILSLLRQHELVPDGKQLNDVNTQQIEDCIKKIEVVKDAQCYERNDGVVVVELKQREPFLRVISTDNYYIDTERRAMRASFQTAAFVPVVTGYVTPDMAANELYDFVEWIESNSYWRGEIQQININSKKQVELIQRHGKHTILLGKLDEDYKQRLHKLQVFYEKGVSKIGWEDYKEIDLQYAGQVICRK